MLIDDTITHAPRSAELAASANGLTTISRAITDISLSAAHWARGGIGSVGKSRLRDGGLHLLADYVRQARTSAHVYQLLVEVVAQVAHAERVELLRFEYPGRSPRTVASGPVVAEQSAAAASSPPDLGRHWLSLPLALGNQPWGSLRILMPRRKRLLAHVVRWLTTLATLAAVAEEGLRSRRVAAQTAPSESISGLYEQPVLSALLDHALLQANRRREPLAVVHVELDSSEGDLDPFASTPSAIILQRVAQAILGTLRASDIVGRLDADRFAVVLPAADAESAPAIADAIRKAITEASLTSSSAERLTASVGIACYPRDGETANALHTAAASALACARAVGGDSSISARCSGHDFALRMAPCAV